MGFVEIVTAVWGVLTLLGIGAHIGSKSSVSDWLGIMLNVVLAVPGFGRVFGWW